jgi:hypothetical protein
MACIYADACSDAMARCTIAKLPPVQRHYSARETSDEDNESSVLSLIVGHTTSHAPSWRPCLPPHGQGLDRMRRMKKNAAPNKNQI